MLQDKNTEPGLTANDFIETLAQYKAEKEFDKVEKYFKGNDGLTKAFGVKFRDIFSTAEKFTQMPLNEIGALLESEYYEIRMGALVLWIFKPGIKRLLPKEKKNYLICI